MRKKPRRGRHKALAIAMGVAIAVMVLAMHARGVAVSLAMPAIVAVIVVLTSAVTAIYLRNDDRILSFGRARRLSRASSSRS